MLFNLSLRRSQLYLKLQIRYGSQTSKVRVRFAPSPTGQLHLGGFRTAFYNYLIARANEGKFILRIEDTDQTRAVPGAMENIQGILNWAGLNPDEGPSVGGDYGPYIQSQRLGIYAKYAKTLLEKNHAYPCFCSERRLEIMRKEAARNRENPKYDGQCRSLTSVEVEEKLMKNVPHVIRFKLDTEIITFNDLIFGTTQTIPAESEGDPILIKSDGFPTYHFANVVDDHLMEITHVLRGVEWHGSTPKHLSLYKAFEWEPPQFAHLPLIINKDGSKLSKRQGDVHVDDYRKKGFYPETLTNFVTHCGGGFGAMRKMQLNTLQDLIKSFSLESVNSCSARLDFIVLEDLNRMAIKQRLESSLKTGLVEDLRQHVQLMLKNKNLKVINTGNDYLEKVLHQFSARIFRLDQLVRDEYLYIWTEPQYSTQLLASANMSPEILVSCEKALESLVSFSKNEIVDALRKCSKQNSLKFEHLMKIIRIVTTGSKEGTPVAEVLEFLGKENSLQRIKNVCKLLSTLDEKLKFY